MWVRVVQRRQLVTVHAFVLRSEVSTHAQLEFLPTEGQELVGEIHTVPLWVLEIRLLQVSSVV